MEVQFGLSHYYRQREGASGLSRTLQSSEVWTPQQLPQRVTVSPNRYEEYLATTAVPPRLPWGREREYGGIGPVSLPDDHRPKTEPPPLEAKGHKHYGYGGDTWPRGIPIKQYYEITQLKKSNVRASDDLYPKPPSASINDRQLDVEFPAEHPYHSHISKCSMFPNFEPPEDLAHSTPVLHPQCPARPYSTIILRKTKGNPYRHEVIYTPPGSLKERLVWPGQDGFYHFPKGHQENGQTFYPTPPKTMAPNALSKSHEETLSDRTVNLQKNIIKSQWLTSYNRSFTGQGEMSPLQLDDFHQKRYDQIIGQKDENTELKQTFTSAILQGRPQEGQNDYLQDGRQKPGMREELQKAYSELQPSQSSEAHCVESDTYQPTHSTRLPEFGNDSLAFYCDSRKYPTEQEAVCYTPLKVPPDFRKITDTELFDALYRRQLTPKSTTVEENQKPPKSLCYEDIQPSKLANFMISNKPFSLPKPLIKNKPECDAQVTKILKAEENKHIARMPPTRVISGKEIKRPRTASLELQDSYIKSEVCKKFHQNFPEKTKDLRKNHYSGKKHTFYGFNSFYFHN
ncbi:sperm-associated microtubule inner protein 4 [Pelobates fuscus]|uniref:sperm-associated microtubule inner protein 4 n=1 Tax=Pelobates fuscus TaxID=191477 RepID=UPI002FE4F924